MSKIHFFIFSLVFSALIITSNYTVQYAINDWLTFGAVAYPLTYLFSDVLSEKFHKQETLKIVQFGSIFAIIPTIYLTDIRIAIASITAFFLIQQLDVYLFHYIKMRLPTLWWIRNNGSTLTSQFFDTIVFWCIAFGGTMPISALVKFMIGDYAFKVIAAILDTPFFYLLAIKTKFSFFRKI